MNSISKSSLLFFKTLCVGVCLLMSINLHAATQSPHPLAVTNLKCEYRHNPLGIDAAQPRLSWQFESAQRGQRQTAYRVLAAESLETLINDEGTLWDSGRVESAQSVHIVYAGAALASHTRVWWKVMVWDADGKPTAWSDPANWTMGILTEADWGGEWIGRTTERVLSLSNKVNSDLSLEADSADEEKAATESDLNPNAAVLMRKTFKAERHLASATASICGLGYYELFINGQRIGDHRLDPGWTDYDKRCLYATYNVTDAIEKGRNAIGVRLGNGFYNQTTPDIWGFHEADWAAPPKLRFHLRLAYDDGSVETVVSDGTWSQSTDEVVYQNIRSGETVDHRQAKPGWNTSDHEMDETWQSAKIVPAPRGRLAAQKQPPIKAIREVSAIALTEPAPGVYVYKLAENFTGWFRFQTTGEEGQRLTFTCDERVHPEGTVHQMNTGFTFGRFQTDELILSGEGVETFEPHFTYHGFQYVQIDGLDHPPSLGDLVGIKAHTALENAGQFACSSEMLNTLHTMARRTYLNNLHSIPTDCPHREKLGWLADGVISAYLASYNYDTAALYTKWAEDMVDNQYEDGGLSPVIPGCGWAVEGVPPFDISWGGAIVMVPWIVYQQYGDTRLLADHYDAMKLYVDLTREHMEDGLFTDFQLLGDWLEVNRASTGEVAAPSGVSVRTPPVLANSASGYYCAWILARTAELLGKAADAAHYDAFAADIAQAINAKYLDTEKGTYGPDTQAAPAMALAMGFAPADQREKILAALEDNILNVSDGHVSTGIVATHYLMQALFDAGRGDLAYRILTEPKAPGWGHMILSGSTTLWESWEGGSLNHPGLGCYDTFFYRNLAGIQAVEPGFSSIRIKPTVLKELKWVRGSYDSIRGRIASNWRIEDGSFNLDVSIPANTTATVWVPVDSAEAAEAVTEGGQPTAEAQGVRPEGFKEGYAVYEVGSGEYHFAVASPRK